MESGGGPLFLTQPALVAETSLADGARFGVGTSTLIRQWTEALEGETLSPYAMASVQSKGRERDEEPCSIRTVFQRDRDRILHSKSFRRLKGKTQVFISPQGDHYRTRLTHTLEVAQIARTIARSLRLNEDLTEAIALGHDLGHPPFGHAGESVLDELSSFGFSHTSHSIRLARVLEPLNLTHEVLDGMAQQAVGGKPNTLETRVVELADRMAYLHHDVEDAVRADLMDEKAIPKEIINVLGPNRQTRLNTMVMDLITTSQRALKANRPEIAMTEKRWEAMMALRKWMFQQVYLSDGQLAQKEKIRRTLTGLFEFLCQQPEAMGMGSNTQQLSLSAEPVERLAIDYIAGMTDRFAYDLFLKTMLPNALDHQESLMFRFGQLNDPVADLGTGSESGEGLGS